MCVYTHLLVCTSVRSCFRGYCNPWFELHLMILGDSGKCFQEETSGMIGKNFSKKLVPQWEKNVNEIIVILFGVIFKGFSAKFRLS